MYNVVVKKITSLKIKLLTFYVLYVGCVFHWEITVEHHDDCIAFICGYIFAFAKSICLNELQANHMQSMRCQ